MMPPTAQKMPPTDAKDAADAAAESTKEAADAAAESTKEAADEAADSAKKAADDAAAAAKKAMGRLACSSSPVIEPRHTGLRFLYYLPLPERLLQQLERTFAILKIIHIGHRHDLIRVV